MGKLFKAIFYVYAFLAFFVFAPYYNWQFAKDNGFVSWIFLGQIVPTMKATVWPYYAFSHTDHPASRADNYVSVNFVNSLNYSNQAAMLTKSETVNGEVAKKMLDLYENALEEGSKVDVNGLNNIYPDFGNNYKKDYLKGLERLVNGFKSGDKQVAYQGYTSLTKWNNWYSANVDAIRKSGSGI